MAEMKITPRFDFTSLIPVDGEGQNHTLAKVPNNNLAPEKFNEYERVMVLLTTALGDYGFSNDIVGLATDDVGSAVRYIWDYAYTEIPLLKGRATVLEDDLDDLEILQANDNTALQNTKYDKVGGAISGAVTMGSTLGVTGVSTFAAGSFSGLLQTTNGLTVSGSLLTANNGLTVIGASTFAVGSFSGLLQTTNGLTVSGAILTASNGLTVTGAGAVSTTFGVGTNLTVTGTGAIGTTLSVGTDLTVTGKATVNGATGLAVPNGPAAFGQTLDVTSTSTFGDDVTVDGHIDVDAIFMEWGATTDYIIGDVVTYNGVIYICNTAHTSGAVFAGGNWDTAGALAGDGTVTEAKIEANFLKLIKTDPVNTVKMYDAADWVDNTTIPGWWACTGVGGTPNLVDSFVMAKGIAGAGSFDGAVNHIITLATNQLPSHAHTIAHTHDVDIDHDHGTFNHNGDGSHQHNILYNVVIGGGPAVTSWVQSPLGAGGSTGNTELSTIDLTGIDIPNYTVANVTSTAASNANSGNEGAGANIDITPYHYKIIFIKRMV